MQSDHIVKMFLRSTKLVFQDFAPERRTNLRAAVGYFGVQDFPIRQNLSVEEMVCGFVVFPAVAVAVSF